MPKSNTTKFYSQKQEDIVAKALRGYRIGGSGAAPGVPGDVKTYDWLVECKTHMESGKNIFFDLDVWNKVQNEAMAMHKKPVLIVDDGSQSLDKTWCLCRSANLNLSSTIVAEFPKVIRKNITASSTALTTALKKLAKEYPQEIYEHAAFYANWGGQEVTILPLSEFKELFEK